ncbi:ATP-binding protein [Enterocloster clostridioformis]|uniref:ATP-binding protein n=1 Tax=Enterocloster clostridioformis TaxID=1531 RepID=UPI0008F27E96|nr:ATP-binding protein [Enterocloster clostridioformis]SFG87533.1 Histidine kinase-, DNA gyrase B-, and HSP90-like ATPase [Enterocloster clostridioformis]
MKNNRLLPYETFVHAASGEPEAVGAVLQYYRRRFSKDTQGVGPGLPLAKAIIEAHNGTIEVQSELGVGTTFVVNFLIPNVGKIRYEGS